MFRADLLPIIRSLKIVYTAVGTYCCVYSVETPDDRQYICPKHVEEFIKINLRNSHLIGFYYKK